MRGTEYRTTEELLTDAIAAAAVVDNAVVSLACTPARTAKHVDIGVYTLKPFRRRGLARAVASLVARKVQQGRQIPIWSTGHSNTASLSLAKVLGFREVVRMTYVVLGQGD